MKTAVQFAAFRLAAFQLTVSTTALAALLAAFASHATPLSELPLKASVFAKPNVVFAMDDSGSMDWEVLLSTDSGLAWWNGNSGFDSTTNKPLNSSNLVPYGYLFPVGTAIGGSIYPYNSVYRQAAPPVGQFAWLRSSKFNPLYYNSAVTYDEWAPATVDSNKTTFADANPADAVAHPAISGAPKLALSTQWQASNGNFSANGYRFYVQAGTRLPAGTVVQSNSAYSGGSPCSGNTQTLVDPQTVPNGRACWASIPYYPATFWAPDTACSANDVDCVDSPDLVGKLKRYEIKSGNSFPSGRSYANELQNFANWFSYSRKRKLMLASSMGHALENVTGLRMAVMPFNETPTLAMSDADSTDDTNNRFSIAGRFYKNAMAGNGTPTHATMSRIGTQFDTNTNIVQFACQRNSMFVVTDGFANASSETAPAYTAATYGGAAPYQTTPANSLADFALAYYTNRLRASGPNVLTAGRVPPGNLARPDPDINSNLHVTTYAITLGTRGTLYPNVADPFATNVYTSPPTWPALTADSPTMIDDLWHATVNGRGRMYLANDVSATTQAIQSALDDIATAAGAQGGVAVSSVNLDSGDQHAYLGVYDANGWKGDLTKNPIDVNTAVVSATPAWSAATLLAARSWTTRVLFSSSGNSGVAFNASGVGAAVAAGSGFAQQATVDFLSGNRSGEGTLYRKRSSLLGAVVNAEPVLAREERVVYVASGEGMLHAFDTQDGSEQWAYAPPAALNGMGKSMVRGWVYQTLLDATPVVSKLGAGGKLLVGGMGAAGRSYYALNVSSPRGLTQTQAAAQFRWTFPNSANAANMGYTVGKPVIARAMIDNTLTDVVLVTSGYDNGQNIGDKRGRLWVLRAADGFVLKTFRTTAGTGSQEAGLAHVAAFKETDGSVQYAYGGDLLGNLWKFDLSRAGTDLDAEALAHLQDASGNAQPVTSVPELTTKEGKRVVLVGTGRLLDIGDFGSSNVQSFYAIADGTELTNARAGLVRQIFTQSTGSLTNSRTAAFDWKTDRGWYFDLPAGQQANTDPVIAYGAVAFATNVNGQTDCTQSSYLYLVDVGSGGKSADASFVVQTISDTENSSRILALRTVGGKIVGTTHKSNNGVFGRELLSGKTVKPQKNAWKEIRR